MAPESTADDLLRDLADAVYEVHKHQYNFRATQEGVALKKARAYLTRTHDQGAAQADEHGIHIQICDACHERYEYVWWAPNDLWNQLAERESVLCLPCFDLRARNAGISLRYGAEDLALSAQPPAPSGEARGLIGGGL
jgi:hypothetical protein